MSPREAGAKGDRHGPLHSRRPHLATVKEAGAPSRLGWTLVLRRQPIRIVGGQPQGGYTDVYELICCYCDDDSDLDYRDVSPELQRIRGPYPIAAGIAAYGRHHPRHASQLGGASTARGRP